MNNGCQQDITAMAGPDIGFESEALEHNTWEVEEKEIICNNKSYSF